MLSVIYDQVNYLLHGQAAERVLTIVRLRAADFEPSKDQRQALNKWNKFVLGETYEKELAKLKPPQTKQCVASVFIDSSYQLHHSLADIRQRKSPSTKHQHLLPPLVHPRQRSFSPRLSANTKLHLGL